MIRHLNARKLQNQKKVTDERTDGRMNEWTNGRTNIRINNLRWLQHKYIAKISSMIWLYFHSIKSPSHPPDIPENSFSWFVSVFGWGDPFTISPFFFVKVPLWSNGVFYFFLVYTVCTQSSVTLWKEWASSTWLISLWPISSSPIVWKLITRKSSIYK